MGIGSLVTTGQPRLLCGLCLSPTGLLNSTINFTVIYLNSINSGSENWVVVFDSPPVFGSVGVRQVASVLFQNIQCSRQSLKRCKGLTIRTTQNVSQKKRTLYTVQPPSLTSDQLLYLCEIC